MALDKFPDISLHTWPQPLVMVNHSRFGMFLKGWDLL
ncbi:hypothetical protein BRADI_4g43705v3 [Brachypodium distachyon]|uniref:Uncharacterized protein n=1 Tax=Brachypodium distachyon TaxID=15368 RepID=A0A0Q3LIN3_BRADI|nr:hypothetical protein BRADI_4g43705v3 [Brachypodium distachyon]